MNIKTSLRLTTAKLVFITFCFTLLPTMKAISGDSSVVLPEYVYTPSNTPKEQVETALAKAKAENKYALIVLGAQWCHDSVGLAARFSSDEMQSILSERFVTQFIDVGYFEDLRDITNLVAYPNYFATPTVMIVNPVTNTIENIDSMTIWQSADSVEMETYIEEFSKWNTNEIKHSPKTTKENKVLAEFEKQQSARLQKGYEELGPMLAASEDSSEQTNEEKEQFWQLWKEVKTFRTSVQASIHQMRKADIPTSELEQALLKLTPKTQSWEETIGQD
jgi:hypothetical protein